MIDLKGMVSIPFLKKAVFTGSSRGMNFLLRKLSGEDGKEDRLQAAVWPGPFIFAVTEEGKKIFQDFSFSPEGLKEAVDWLNQIYEARFAPETSPSEPAGVKD